MAEGARRERPAAHPGGPAELAVGAAAVVALSLLVAAPAVWAVALLLAAGVAAGTLHLRAADPREAAGGPEAAILPAVAAFAALGTIRLVPAGPILVPAVLLAGLLVERVVRHETIGHGRAAREGQGDPRTLPATVPIVAFLAFVAAAALVPGGLPEPGAGGTPGAQPLPQADLALLASVDAVVAGLLGYRAAVARGVSPRRSLWAGVTGALAVGIAAAALRAAAVPRLLGPAILTLVLFLWDALQGSPRRRRDPRSIWQLLLLVLLGAAVVAWNLRLR